MLAHATVSAYLCLATSERPGWGHKEVGARPMRWNCYIRCAVLAVELEKKKRERCDCVEGSFLSPSIDSAGSLSLASSSSTLSIFSLRSVPSTYLCDHTTEGIYTMLSKIGLGSRGDGDVEKAPRIENAYESRSNETSEAYDNVSDGAVPGESFEYGDSLYARIQRVAGKFRVEQRGIERVPENERTDTSYFNISSMWLAANMVVSSFAIGTLANSIFYLGFVDAILVCLFFNLLGILTVCFFSCFGPAFGLRQMVLSRFYFGWIPVKFSKLRRESGLARLQVMADQRGFHSRASQCFGLHRLVCRKRYRWCSTP